MKSALVQQQGSYTFRIPWVPVDGESFHVKTLIRHAQGFIKIKFASEFWSHKNIISRKRGYKQTCLGIHVFKLMCALRHTNQWRCCARPEDRQGRPGFISQLTYVTPISHVCLKPSRCHNGPWKASLPVAALLSAWRVRGGTGPALALGTPGATCSEERVGTKATLSLWSESHQATLSPQGCASGFTAQSQFVHLNEFPHFSVDSWRIWGIMRVPFYRVWP